MKQVTGARPVNCVLHNALRDTRDVHPMVKDSLKNGFVLEKDGKRIPLQLEIRHGRTNEAEMVGAERTKVGALRKMF